MSDGVVDDDEMASSPLRRKKGRPHKEGVDGTASSVSRNGRRRNNGHHRRQRDGESVLKVVVPLKPPPPRRGSLKYPRTAMIAGRRWTRCHSKEEQKYFWTLDDATNGTSSWDPWTESGGKAPWFRSSCRRWNKFKDDEQRPYWYDYQSKKSTYSRPKDYESEELIEDDSDPDAQQDQ